MALRPIVVCVQGLWIPVVHDGVISSLRSYSPSALRALAEHADPSIGIELRGGLVSAQVAVASRRSQSL